MSAVTVFMIVGQLRLRGFCVEDDNFADTGSNESFFRHVEAAKNGEELALNLVVGKSCVGVGGLEEEAHGL